MIFLCKPALALYNAALSDNPKPMSHFSLLDIPYRSDSSTYFDAIRDLPNPVWLDSCRPLSHMGRYDIISANPGSLLITEGATTRIQSPQGTSSSTDNPFDLVAEALAPISTSQANKDLPFCGGALGYFGYDLGRRLEQLPSLAEADVQLPDMAIGIYDWAIVQDHHQQHAWLIFLPSCTAPMRNDLEARCRDAGNISQEKEEKSFNISGFKEVVKPKDYEKAIAVIHDYIDAGDCYQVNFTQRFSATYQGDCYQAYRHLRQILPSPFSAFMGMDNGAILSHSPERFLHLAGKQVETKPIKGTLPRHADPTQDQANAIRLQQSAKDRAENLMIVDLLRNDLSKTCTLGSVRVPDLFAIESFPNVHHLVSTVMGTLDESLGPIDLLKGCFPGGSITGAPKLRAMEIIEELEPFRRSVYCGSIGYISANGNMDTNIAIRTLACDRHNIHCWGGGAITADSSAKAEYQESLDKIGVLLRSLEAFSGLN